MRTRARIRAPVTDKSPRKPLILQDLKCFLDRFRNRFPQHRYSAVSR
jgi:hypothetical protein